MDRTEHLEKIKEADTAYYDNADPVMSDQEYDILRATYIARYGTEDLDYVPGKPVTNRRFKHPIEVTSLAKVDENDTVKYDAELKRLSPVVVEPKYDGLTIVAYPDGKGGYFFVTRGSGVEGDILPSFHPIKKTGKQGIDWVSDNTEYAIRGEAYMTQDAFEKMNKELVSNGEEPKANPRNAVAGILNPARKEESPFMHYVSYTCYDIIGMDAPETKKLEYIRKHTPFEATWASCLHDCNNDFEQARKYIRTFMYDGSREKGIPVDGMVLKTDQEHSLARWGSTAHHPRNAAAVKVAQKIVVTTIRNIHWQVGKTGVVTPVADFDPVDILGSTVSQASLSNPDEIERLNLREGDRIAVIKAKEIIPKIVMNYGGGNPDKPFTIPQLCPSCRKPLMKDGPVLYCKNSHCPDILASKLAFMARKDVLDIPGFGIEICKYIVKDTLFHSGDSFTFDELFWHTEEEFDGLGEKRAKNLASAMQHAMNMPHPFRNWLPSLCMDGVGHTAADKLLQHYHTVDAVKKAIFSGSREKLLKIPGFGSIVVDKLLSDELKARWTMMEYIFPIKAVSVNIKDSLRFTNKHFALTGKMEHPRSYYEELIKNHGGTVSSSVSKNTDYLVIADVNSTSTKAEKARKFGTTLIRPEDLEDMFG